MATVQGARPRIRDEIRDTGKYQGTETSSRTRVYSSCLGKPAGKS